MKKIPAFLLFLICAGSLLVSQYAVAQRKSPSVYENSPVGYFHFRGDEELNPEYFGSAYVRVAVSWGEFEPKPGKFVWGPNNNQAQKIDNLIKQGKRVIPSIRAKSRWAVHDPKGSKCSSAPVDLDMKSPLKDNVIYSKSYYAFIKAIAEHYKGKFPIVVIENEMNDPENFWCSSVDAYLRLFSTAKKAFWDTDPKVRLADGGIQGYVLNWMMIQDFLERKEIPAALKFYEKFSGQSISEKDLLAEAATRLNDEAFVRGEELYKSNLFELADIVNFHYYQRAEALPEVTAFLRRRMPARKLLMTNEIGIKEKFVDNINEAAQQLVKKCAYLLALGVKPVIWFAPGGDENHNAGALAGKNGEAEPTMKNSFEAVGRFLGRSDLLCMKESDEKMEKVACHTPTETISVLWSKAVQPVSLLLKKDCEVFDYQNQPLEGTEVLLNEKPVFIVCKQ